MANKNKIVYGDRVFEGNKIKSGNLHIATSLLSSSLEANTLSVVIETEDRTITEFERNAPIVYFYDDVQTGVFYVKSIDRNALIHIRYLQQAQLGFYLKISIMEESTLERLHPNFLLPYAAQYHTR